MKQYTKSFVTAILFLSVVGLVLVTLAAFDHASACNWGSQGGQDYVPQRRGSSGPLAQKPAITKEQVYEIVANHIKRLNPDLAVGQINDAGTFYEAEILSKNMKMVQLMGVDKISGRLMLIN